MKSLDKIRYKFTKKSGKVAYIQLIINCGSDNDTIAGIAHLVEHLFLKVELNNSCLKDDINSIGAKITGRCMHKKTIFTICFKREEIETLKTIIESAINNIESCAQYYEREKFIVLEELNIKLNDLEWKLSNYVYNIYSNDKDRTILGNENSINSITKENILEFIKLNYTIDNMFINCIGDFKESIGASSNIHFLNIKDNYIYFDRYD